MLAAPKTRHRPPAERYTTQLANRTLNWLHGEPLSMIGSMCFLVDQRASRSLRSAAHIIPTSSYSQKNCILQKRAVRIITGHGGRTSCRNLFKQLKILPMKYKEQKLIHNKL
jgi:hypothetical protein